MITNDKELRLQYELLKRYIQKLTVENRDEERLIENFEQARRSMNEIFSFQLEQTIQKRDIEH
ncbi:MAG: hypothetical protein IJ091_00795 [Oscillospiraceae bacterium]|nr:hypothetical protein [Oscillospiraceae bacterium]